MLDLGSETKHGQDLSHPRPGDSLPPGYLSPARDLAGVDPQARAPRIRPPLSMIPVTFRGTGIPVRGRSRLLGPPSPPFSEPFLVSSIPPAGSWGG